jgi:hypothetical protein
MLLCKLDRISPFLKYASTDQFTLAGWGSWTFSARPTVSGDNLTLHFTAGGNQEARGDKEGGPSYIDNALCELDAPGEWFWDANTQTLFMAQNGSVPLPTKLVAPQLETLIHGEIYMYAFTSVSSQTEVSEISQGNPPVRGSARDGPCAGEGRHGDRGDVGSLARDLPEHLRDADWW